ncbi:MAG: hypothetical protein AUK01_06330 [Anaerolineae bacterium CG2_30_57_67]|nr:MAG: hypothetical protein AUK01_06330 [Anaerolineae bacterium CG2_30_57_67]
MDGINIEIGGNFSDGNLIVGDHNQILTIGGDLIFNAAQNAERQERDLRKMLRVLVLLAAPIYDARNPQNEIDALNLQAEWLRLSEAVRASGAPIALIRLMPPTLDALRFALSPRVLAQGLYPHVLHFSGHAWQGGLLLEDEFGQSDAVSTPRLLEALKDAPALDLAVFNACESAENAFSAAQAFAASGRARASIGHPDPVRDDDAIHFAAQLYAEMARGAFPLHEAFARAAKQVTNQIPRLFGDASLRLTNQEDAPPLIDAAFQPGNLPARQRFFFGRGKELADIARNLKETPCINIISGVSGMGKTALALEAAGRGAWRFPGGVAFAEGKGAPSAEFLLRGLASALNLPISTGQPPEETLLAFARQSPALFVLDNLEGLPAPELARLAAFLRRLAGGSAALVTLRPPAPIFEDLPTARAFPLLQGLAPAAARCYALELGQQRRLNAALLAEFAQTLAQKSGGHPLIVEKVIAQAAKRPLTELRHALETLSGDYLTILQTVMDWSVAGLNAESRQALACLPMFGAGSCAPQAWAAALNLPLEALYPLADSLREAALVNFDAPSQRYQWHASVSDYARASLTPADSDPARQRAVSQICAVFNELPASADPANRADLLPDLLNLSLLADWAGRQTRGDSLAQMSVAPRNWWFVLSYQNLISGWLQTALNQGIQDDRLKANVLKAIGDVQNFRDERDAALASYGEALKLFRQVGDRLGEANVLKAIGDVQNFRKEMDAALASYGEALKLFRQVGARLGEANVLSALCRMDIARGKLEDAEQKLAQIIEMRRAIGDLYSEGADLGNFALALSNAGYNEKAKFYALRALPIFEKIQLPAIVEMMRRVINSGG